MAEELPIGKVSSLTGQATAQSVQGVVRPLADDVPVFEDDIITTPQNSNVELLFEDGTIFAQGENSEIKLDVYIYDANAGSGELLFNLAKGSLRAVSGEIAKLNPRGFNVETPLSTVGIRGTGFFVILSPDGQVVGVEVMDPNHVVVVETDQGQVTIAQAGGYVAVQLDGFLSDPTMFTPEFLQEVQNLAPLQGDPPSPEQGLTPGQETPDANDIPADVPQEALDDLTDALQLLQSLDSSGDLQEVLDSLSGAIGDASDPTDTAEELHDLLNALQQTLGNISNAITNLADDILTGDTVESVVAAALNLQTLELNTDGTAYSAQLQSMGYSFVQPTGDANNNAMLGTAGGNSFIGAQGNDILFGAGGDDTLTGGLGNDYIYGGTGNDIIFGNGGSDYLVGGDNNDQFKYDLVPSAGEVDTIRDFTSGEDKLYFKYNVFNLESTWSRESIPGFSGNYTGASTEPLFIYNPTNGNVYHDSDGNGSATSVLICTLEGAPTIDVNTDIDSYS